MTPKSTERPPSIADSQVAAKTGKNWHDWFRILDNASAVTLSHTEIAAILTDVHGVPSWWRQMIAVEYERARGLRVRHQTARGFSVSVSLSAAVSVSDLYQATANSSARVKWFPRGDFAQSSRTKDTYYRGTWNGSARIAMGFYKKGETKAQVTIQISKLKISSQVESERAAWKGALAKLKLLLQSRRLIE
jgi:hypothetical protein